MSNDPHLDYRDPRDDSPPETFFAQAAGGAVGTALFLVGAVAALIYFAFSMDYRGWNQPSGTTGSIIAACTGVAIVVALLFIAQRKYRDPKTRGWAFGIWIGFGIAISVEGFCFMLRR